MSAFASFLSSLVSPSTVYAEAPEDQQESQESRQNQEQESQSKDVEEEPAAEEVTTDDVSEADGAADVTINSAEDTEQDGASTVAQSRIHSRHVSKLSAALSLRSVGGMMEDEEIVRDGQLPLQSPGGELEVEDLDVGEDVDAGMDN